MPINAESRPGATQDAQSASFAPVPAGWYDGTIVGAKQGTYGRDSKSAGKANLNIRVKVVKNAPKAAGREFFVDVPLFSHWSPSPKYPDGYPTLYASFFSALGVSESEIDAGRIPFEVSDLGGKAIGFKISLKGPDNFKDEEYNKVEGFRKSTAGTPSAVRAEVGDVWGTASEPTPAPVDDVWGGTPSAALAAAAESGQGF